MKIGVDVVKDNTKKKDIKSDLLHNFDLVIKEVFVISIYLQSTLMNTLIGRLWTLQVKNKRKGEKGTEVDEKKLKRDIEPLQFKVKTESQKLSKVSAT